jgi:hypothetical protein
VLITLLINVAIGGVIALLFRRSLAVRGLLVCAVSLAVFLLAAHRSNQALAGEYDWYITVNYLLYMAPVIGVFFSIPMMAGNVLVTRLWLRYRGSPSTYKSSHGLTTLAIAYMTYGIVLLAFSLWWGVGAFNWVAKDGITSGSPSYLELALGLLTLASLMFAACSFTLGYLIRRKSGGKWIVILGAITCFSVPVGTLLGLMLVQVRRNAVLVEGGDD